MAKHAELNEAIKIYVCDEIARDQIPDDYYWDTIKTWHRKNTDGHKWTTHKAAAALLHVAFNEGFLQPSTLTPEGHQALTWADTFMRQSNESLRVGI